MPVAAACEKLDGNDTRIHLKLITELISALNATQSNSDLRVCKPLFGTKSKTILKLYMREYHDFCSCPHQLLIA
jgi:hypothetical protein